MKSIQALKNIARHLPFKKALAVFVFLKLSLLHGFSQTIAESDTTIYNEAPKGVFAELKSILTSSNSNLSTILIIVGVLAIVGVAMYISFKEPEEKTQKSKK